MPAPLLPIVLGLAQYAPSLMRYFGAGEASADVAAKVVGIAQTITGAQTPEQALESIRASTQLQTDFQLRVMELHADLDKAYLADRADARARDAKLREAGQHNSRADWMVVLDVVGLVACLAVLVLFKGELPGEVVGIVSTVAGIFGACLRDAHQFEFGSSRGSREKDELLAKAAQGPAP